MSDAEYRVNDLERTIEELRALLNNARECWYEAARRAGEARIEAARWKMLYEQARDE
jgi:hypothetical protein